MGQEFLIDSNVIIDYNNDVLPETAISFVENIFEFDFSISIITKIEVLGFDEIPSKMKIVEEFLSGAELFYVDDLVINKTISLRKKHKKLKLGDAIIAATAMVHNFTLITRNIKDFQNIQGLLCLNPHEMV
jgi:toxin FitB